jgi:GT2 family glycosyltransferase
VSVPVSIVIPVHNQRALLERLLHSIEQQTAPPLEIIVVDNDSSDGAAESAHRAGASVIPMRRNAGFAAAVNRGIREAKGDSVAVINSDVVLDCGWLDILWSGVRETGSDFATGKILQEGSPEILDGSYDLICRGACPWRAGAGRPASSLPDCVESIRLCSATAAIYRSDLFTRIGLFEESFESYLEDVDFGLRCASAGCKGSYVPRAISWHRGSATFGRWHPEVVRRIARNQLLLVARNYPGQLIRRWLWPIIVAQLLWGMLALRHGRGLAWLSGKIEGLRRFAGARRESRQSLQLGEIIAESELRIAHLQSASGFDLYWKVYFGLTRTDKAG